LERIAPDGGSRVICVHNTADRAVVMDLEDLAVGERAEDLCGMGAVTGGKGGTIRLILPPYGVRWLRPLVPQR
jgi:hypothetical protein